MVLECIAIGWIESFVTSFIRFERWPVSLAVTDFIFDDRWILTWGWRDARLVLIVKWGTKRVGWRGVRGRSTLVRVGAFTDLVLLLVLTGRSGTNICLSTGIACNTGVGGAAISLTPISVIRSVNWRDRLGPIGSWNGRRSSELSKPLPKDSKCGGSSDLASNEEDIAIEENPWSVRGRDRLDEPFNDMIVTSLWWMILLAPFSLPFSTVIWGGNVATKSAFVDAVISFPVGGSMCGSMKGRWSSMRVITSLVLKLCSLSLSCNIASESVEPPIASLARRCSCSVIAVKYGTISGAIVSKDSNADCGIVSRPQIVTARAEWVREIRGGVVEGWSWEGEDDAKVVGWHRSSSSFDDFLFACLFTFCCWIFFMSSIVPNTSWQLNVRTPLQTDSSRTVPDVMT